MMSDKVLLEKGRRCQRLFREAQALNLEIDEEIVRRIGFKSIADYMEQTGLVFENDVTVDTFLMGMGVWDMKAIRGAVSFQKDCLKKRRWVGMSVLGKLSRRCSREVKYKIFQEHRIFEPILRFYLSSRQNLFLTKTEKEHLALINEEFGLLMGRYKKDDEEIDGIMERLRYEDFVGAVSDYAEAFVEDIDVVYKELYFLVSLQKIKEVRHLKNWMDYYGLSHKMFIKKYNLKDFYRDGG